MKKPDKLFVSEEHGCYVWYEDRQLWINPYGGEIQNPQSPPPGK